MPTESEKWAMILIEQADETCAACVTGELKRLLYRPDPIETLSGTPHSGSASASANSHWGGET